MGSFPQPTLGGFQEFVYVNMGVPETAILPTSQWITWAYEQSIATVNRRLQRARGPIYLIAVYNLAGHFLLMMAPDLPGSVYPTNNPPEGQDGPQLGYFAYLRAQWNLNGFVAGVINASSDESTSQTMTIPKVMENLQFTDLEELKTPYGQKYLGLAAKVGSNWGIS